MSSFQTSGYEVWRGALGAAVYSFLYEYAVKAAAAGMLPTSDQSQVPNTPYFYADPMMEALLEKVQAPLESKTGLSLAPTYSYFRVYKHCDVLARHTDRPSCEISL